MKTPDQMTMHDHAEAWMTEQGKAIPARDSQEYKALYAQWIDYAFKDFAKAE